MLRYTLIIIFCCLAGNANSQSAGFPFVPQRATEVNDFVPAQWEVYDQCRGDINGDGYADVVLALQTKDSMTGIWESQSLKLLIIAFYDPLKEDYYIVEKSEDFLNPHSSELHPDSFSWVRFDDDDNLLFDFELVFNGSGYYRGYMNFTFRYHNERFELIERDIELRSGGDKLSLNYLCGEALSVTNKGTVNNKIELVTKYGTFEIDELPTFTSIGRPTRLVLNEITWKK